MLWLQLQERVSRNSINPFVAKEDPCYDLFEDYELIEASFAQQYGIRLRTEEDMEWSEFCVLLGGLNEKTPLGRIISIRSENDPKMIKEFTLDQKKIRNEWKKKHAKQMSQDEYNQAMKGFENIFRHLASNTK